MSNKVAIIASNGGLFDAYKVFNIATAAAATEKEVAIFFTFDGLNLIHKQAMQQLPMPEGREHFAEGFAKANIPSISELVELAKEMGVKFIGCQMTMDVMGLTKEDFINGIEVGGAVTFLEFAKHVYANVNFLILNYFLEGTIPFH
ncbi:Peroxiredoxin family protein OS=Ureibacillus acetophenoni OX=614649 GN=SAMN05877842_103141 PE=4 SV=1 [Ureibacillus acetophenoni]